MVRIITSFKLKCHSNKKQHVLVNSGAFHWVFFFLNKLLLVLNNYGLRIKAVLVIANELLLCIFTCRRLESWNVIIISACLHIVYSSHWKKNQECCVQRCLGGTTHVCFPYMPIHLIILGHVTHL